MFPWSVMRNRMLFEGEGVNSGGGGSNSNDGGTQNNQQGDGSNNNNDDGTNNQNNVDDPLNLWDSDDNDDGQGGNNQQQQLDNNNSNNNQNAQTAEEAINAHLDSLGFSSGIDPQTIMQELQDGNVEGLNNAITGMGRQAYQAAVNSLIPVMNRKIEAGIADAVNKSKTVMNSRDAISMLEQAIPSMANPAIAPIGKAVMAQALKKNKGDVPAAIKMTKAYLKAAFEMTGNDLDLNTPPVTTPGSRRRGNSNNGQNNNQNSNNNSREEEIDWSDVFAG